MTFKLPDLSIPKLPAIPSPSLDLSGRRAAEDLERQAKDDPAFGKLVADLEFAITEPEHEGVDEVKARDAFDLAVHRWKSNVAQPTVERFAIDLMTVKPAQANNCGACAHWHKRKGKGQRGRCDVQDRNRNLTKADAGCTKFQPNPGRRCATCRHFDTKRGPGGYCMLRDIDTLPASGETCQSWRMRNPW